MLLDIIKKYLIKLSFKSFVIYSIIAGLLYYRFRYITITSLIACWCIYHLYRMNVFHSDSVQAKWNASKKYIEKHVYLLMVGFIILHLSWSGLVIFSNPYEWGYNHGDAVYFSQTLYNLTHGLHPESSYFTDPYASHGDPRYCSAYGYVSIFSQHQSWFGNLVLPLLYAVYPSPPMQVFSPLVLVVIFGVPGMFWAIRSMGGSKVLALLGGVGYALLPQVECLLFFKGYFDVLALGIMPWIFAGLFARKWWVFYGASLCLAGVSFPYTYSVMFLGLVSAIFFNAALPGVIVFLIGFLVMKFDYSVFVTSVLPYYPSMNEIPSYFKEYVLKRTIESLRYPVEMNTTYILGLLQVGAFLPIFGLRREEKWNLQVIGFFVLFGLYFILMLFRSVGWEVARNANFIVPLYVCSFKVFIDYAGMPAHGSGQRGSIPIRFVATTCLFSTLLFSILCGYRFGGPLASHYPFGGNASLQVSEFTNKRHEALILMERYIPRDAPLAFRSEGQTDAVLANRQHVWHLGREPEGVKYYLFFGDPGSTTGRAEWAALQAKMKQNPTYKLLYEDQSTPMVIFENLMAHPIPRDESLLGWGVLLHIFGKR